MAGSLRKVRELLVNFSIFTDESQIFKLCGQGHVASRVEYVLKFKACFTIHFTYPFLNV